MRTETGRLLATLATEGRQIDDYEGAGSRPVVVARPVGRPLRNDGIRHHWMLRGHTYRVEQDQVGWRVTSPESADWAGHVYRLVEADDMQHVGTLPVVTADGPVALPLEAGRVYELRETEPGGAWGLYEV